MKNSLFQLLFGVIILVFVVFLNYIEIKSYFWPIVEAQILSSKIVKYPYNTKNGTIEKKYSSVNLTYTYLDMILTAEKIIIDGKKVSTGDIIKVSVNPSDPNYVYFRNTNLTAIILFLALGLMFFIVGIINFIKTLFLK